MPAAASPLIRLHPLDNVAVVRRPLETGEELGEGLRAAAVPRGHKVAVAAIPAGEAVRKYGQVIGHASHPIAPGEHVHLHNLSMRETGVEHAFCADARPVPLLPEGERLFEAVLATASGARALSEGFDYGDNEFVPWQIGAVT